MNAQDAIVDAGRLLKYLVEVQRRRRADNRRSARCAELLPYIAGGYIDTLQQVLAINMNMARHNAQVGRLEGRPVGETRGAVGDDEDVQHRSDIRLFYTDQVRIE